MIFKGVDPIYSSRMSWWPQGQLVTIL